MKRRHTIPLGTSISIEGDSQIYITDQYQAVMECSPDCKDDHDCFPEPYINVRVQHWTAVPLSKVKYIYGPDHVGRKATEQDLKMVPE